MTAVKYYLLYHVYFIVIIIVIIMFTMFVSLQLELRVTAYCQMMSNVKRNVYLKFTETRLVAGIIPYPLEQLNLQQQQSFFLLLPKQKHYFLTYLTIKRPAIGKLVSVRMVSTLCLKKFGARTLCLITQANMDQFQ